MATWAGVVYVAFVVDTFSRRIVGWSAATSKETQLVLDALEMALWQRDRACPGPHRGTSRVPVPTGHHRGKPGEALPASQVIEVFITARRTCRGDEVAVHPVRCPLGLLVRDRSDGLLAADGGAGDAQLAHQPLHGAAGHLMTLPVQLPPDLPCPVDGS